MILAASTFTNHTNTVRWAELQYQFLLDTTGDILPIAVVNGCEPTAFEDIGYLVIANCREKASHQECLQIILDYFKKHTADRYLILDSDCWPIRPDWPDILERLMGQKWYAAPARTENFDVFPHPCAVYMRRSTLEIADFSFMPIRNLMGDIIGDCGTAMPKHDLAGNQIWYPLVKTNLFAPHPLYASVYGHLFYHHCAGSRGSGFRAQRYGFYDHIIPMENHAKIYQQLTQELFRRPRQFINQLCGI